LFIKTSTVCAQNFNALIEYSKKNNINTSISVRSLPDNVVTIQYNAKQLYTPASNLKLWTTAYLLDESKRLGIDIHAPFFNTTVGYNGLIKDNILYGDLVIKASGDPTLDQKFIDTILVKLKSLQIKEIQGLIILSIDKAFANPIPADYIWSDMGNYYAAGNYGMNYNANVFNVYFNSGSKVGAPTSFSAIAPLDSTWTIENKVTTGLAGSGDQCIIYVAPYSNKIICEGTIPLGSQSFKVKGALPNPPKLFLNELIHQLNQNQILIPKNNHYITDATIIENISIQYPSISLYELIKEINYQSNNLYASCVFQEFNRRKAVRSLNVWLSNQGIDTTQIDIRDANGLSHFNLIKSSQMSGLLQKMYINKIFVSSIPLVGKEGTVKNFLKSCTTQTRLKSGSMRHTLCYSGYIQGKSGKYFAMALFTNHGLIPMSVLKKEIEKGILEFIETH
jgi:D-alanyl-D-alanine carboxypeptidase/D-alanyl-D-alanine-endopeptidase (penicillin-binding protein 4)